MHDAILLAEAFEKSIGILIKAFITGQNYNIKSFSSFLSISNTHTPSLNKLEEFNQQITKVETGLEGISTKLGIMKNMLEKIFVAVSI